MTQDVFLKKVIEWAAECKDIDFSSELEQFNKGLGLEPRLKAADLRRLLLGRAGPDDLPGFDPARVHRWQITGATIDGRLDLRDARLPSGGPLPALEFKNCTFEQGIVADGAHLERFHLTNCRLGNAPDDPRAELSLQSARVQNEVRLRELRPFCLAPGSVLRVDANAIKVGANFILKRSILRAPLNVDEPDALRLPYALNLRNADIGADLLLQPDLTLEGGLVGVGARIGGDMRAEGLIASDGYTPEFRARQRATGTRRRSPLALLSAAIGGNLWLLTSSSDRRSTLHGEADLRGLHIEGGFHVVGVSIDAAAGEAEPVAEAVALNLGIAQIKGLVGFYAASLIETAPAAASQAKGTAGPSEVPVEIKGQLDVSGASIGGQLWIAGNIPHISGAGILVSGGLRLYLQFPIVETGRSTVQKSVVAGKKDVKQGKSAYGLADFSQATVKAGLTSDVRYEYEGWKPLSQLEERSGLILTGAAITGDLTVTGDYNFIVADNLKLEGDGNFSAQALYRLQLAKAQISGDCDLSGFRFHPWNLRRDVRGIYPVLSMPDADVKRTLRLNRWSDQNMAETVSFVEAKECKPLCYPHLRIVEVKAERKNASGSRREEFWAPFIVFPGRVANVLTSSDVLHAVNARRYLRLETKDEYRDYLRLFCAYVWGDEGAFAIIEPALDGKEPYSKDDVEDGKLPEFKFIKIKLTSRPVQAKAHVRYGSEIFAADFEILKSGEVRMSQDNRLCKLKPGALPRYDPQVFARSGTDESDYCLIRIKGQKHTKLSWLENLIPDWKRPLLRDTVYLANARVDLKDANCGTLEDANGIAWGTEVRLALENFTYDRIATDPFVRRVAWPWRAITEPFRRLWITRQSIHFYLIPVSRVLRRWAAFRPQELPTILQELDPQGRPWFHNIRQSGLSSTGVRERLRWLEQRTQIPDRSSDTVFEPPLLIQRLKKIKPFGELLTPADSSFPEPFLQQPYAQLAKVLREQGNDADAKAVEEQRIRIESWLRAKRSLLGAVALFTWWFPYGILFRYGLSPARAIATFLFCILIGFAGTHHANVNHLLVKGTSTTATFMRDLPKGPEAFVPFSNSRGVSDRECGSSINELIYAVDVFIPLLNLHQEERCDVRSAGDRDRTPTEAYRNSQRGRLGRIGSFLEDWKVWPPAWQFFKFFYAICGRVISSLMLLTVSGALRKWESK